MPKNIYLAIAKELEKCLTEPIPKNYIEGLLLKTYQEAMKNTKKDQRHQMSVLMEKVVKYRNKVVPEPDPEQFISITKAEVEFEISRFKIESAVDEGLIRTKNKPGDKKTNYLISRQDLAIYMMSHDFLNSLKDAGYLKEEVDPSTGRSIWKEISLKATKKGIPDGYVQWSKLEEIFGRLKEVFEPGK